MEKFIDLVRARIKDNEDLYIITSTITLKALYELMPEFQRLNSLKILLNDQRILETRNLNKNNTPSYEINMYESEFLTNEYEMHLKKELLNYYHAKEVAKFIKEKVEIKVCDETQFNFMLFKESKQFIEYCKEININSLNEFKDNLNLYPGKESAENFKLKTFSKHWNNNESFNEEFLNKLEKIFENKTPEFLYHFSLMHIQRNRLKEYENTKIEELKDFESTQIYRSLYDFQKTGVGEIIEKIKTHNGCILADAVGLGKTYEALAVIKYFELERKRVLVLAPKKLHANWSIYNRNDLENEFRNDGGFRYDHLNHTDLSRKSGVSNGINLATLDWSNYDLLVIDESHNFRNRISENKNAENNRYENLMDKIIKSGRKTSVLLLSATPINNRMQDIKNQISFITGDQDDYFNNDTYKIKSIKAVCANAENKANQWAELDKQYRTTEEFQKMIGPKFKTLIDLVSVARSRKNIQENYQNNDLYFPERLQPISISPDIDTENKSDNIHILNQELEKLNFAAYKIWDYIKPQYIERYEKLYREEKKLGDSAKNFRLKDRVKTLLRISLLKRFESSVHSFRLTLEKILISSKEKLKDLSKINDRNLTDDDIDDENDFDEIENNWVNVKVEHLDIARMQSNLKSDVEKLEKIYESFKQIDYKRDQKLKDVLTQMWNKINHPINPGNQKIIIFTSFQDTAEYIYEHIEKQFAQKQIYTALVTGTKQETNHPELVDSSLKMDHILTYFSPKSKNLKDKTNLKQNIQIDILIATDCISEGQNLQDCDFLINYDIHWNPVRIIQRFGRIDRLKSQNRKIQRVNVWPNIELDLYIKLQDKIASKSQKVSVGGTSDFEEENLRDQLRQLDEKDPGIENIKGQNSYSDLTLSEFSADLKLALKTNNSKLTKQPTGIFAIAKAGDEFQPGIIFLFKLNKDLDLEDNDFHPYYLVYISNDNKIIYKHNQAMEILKIYRKISVNQKEQQIEQIKKFEQETEFGKNMDAYKESLNLAINSIINVQEIEQEDDLFDTTKASTETTQAYDYELISFLIIKE